jgi:hypothetical protein
MKFRAQNLHLSFKCKDDREGAGMEKWRGKLSIVRLTLWQNPTGELMSALESGRRWPFFPSTPLSATRSQLTGRPVAVPRRRDFGPERPIFSGRERTARTLRRKAEAASSASQLRPTRTVWSWEQWKVWNNGSCICRDIIRVYMQKNNHLQNF